MLCCESITGAERAFTSAPQSQTAAVLTTAGPAPQGRLHGRGGPAQRCAVPSSRPASETLEPSFQEAGTSPQTNVHVLHLHSLYKTQGLALTGSREGRSPSPGAPQCQCRPPALPPSLPAWGFILIAPGRGCCCCFLICKRDTV